MAAAEKITITNPLSLHQEKEPETLQKNHAYTSRDLRSYLAQKIISNATACEGLDILDLKIIERVIAEYEHAARVFQPYRHTRKVSIFGSARVSETNPYYHLAAEFGHAVARQGFMVITGAASGVMKAGIEGAGTQNSFGVNILLPFEQHPARIMKEDTKLVTFKYFFTRKLFFVMETDAIALFPGGFGTHDEAFEVLTLLQTGKAPLMPVVVMEAPGENYWEEWDKFIREQLLVRGYINREDLSLYRIMHSTDEAAAWIKHYYSTYHSMRQVKNKLVIRLEKELAESQIELISRQFADIINNGNICKSDSLAEEADEPELTGKPRLILDYNKKSAGRLNELVLLINQLGAA